MAAPKPEQLLQKAENLMSFSLQVQAPSDNGPRLGTLSFRGRASMETPNFVATSSRGVVPHLSQDMMRDNTAIQAVYAALEDFVEKAPKQVPPVMQFPGSLHESPLRKFIALQEDALLILGPRRNPPLPGPLSNTWTAIPIVTSVGFGMLELAEYVEAVQSLRPDIVVGLGDLVIGEKPGMKRLEKMGDRTLEWLTELVSGMRDVEDGTPRTALFAPILPIDAEQQWFYLDALKDEFRDSVSGLVIYDIASVAAIPQELRPLPRLSLGVPTSPHRLLDQIFLGIDIFTISFIGAATDAGIALDFTFPARPYSGNEELVPLGIDMWSPCHATDLSPLQQDCACHACSNHHRAYVQHLLSAKEMLGWVLLQVHNHHVLDMFFAGVRSSISKKSFNIERKLFEKSYELDLPAKTGQGPRVRGYQFKSEGKGEPKKNPAAYHLYSDGTKKPVEGPLPSPSADAKDLEQQGFGVKAA